MRQLAVLIVDDDPDLAESLELLLQIEDFAVERAASGEEGLAKLREREFDVFLVDVRLPGMQGTECLRQIRQLMPHAKVLLMSAYSTQDAGAAAREAGALDLLQKPLNLPSVMDTLKAIERREAGWGEA